PRDGRCFCELSNPSLGKEARTNDSDPLGFHSLNVAPLLRRFGLSRLREPIVAPSRAFCLRGLHNLVVKSLPLLVFFSVVCVSLARRKSRVEDHGAIGSISKNVSVAREPPASALAKLGECFLSFAVDEFGCSIHEHLDPLCLIRVWRR